MDDLPNDIVRHELWPLLTRSCQRMLVCAWPRVSRAGLHAARLIDCPSWVYQAAHDDHVARLWRMPLVWSQDLLLWAVRGGAVNVVLTAPRALTNGSTGDVITHPLNIFVSEALVHDQLALAVRCFGLKDIYAALGYLRGEHGAVTVPCLSCGGSHGTGRSAAGAKLTDSMFRAMWMRSLQYGHDRLALYALAQGKLPMDKDHVEHIVACGQVHLLPAPAPLALAGMWDLLCHTLTKGWSLTGAAWLLKDLPLMKRMVSHAVLEAIVKEAHDPCAVLTFIERRRLIQVDTSTLQCIGRACAYTTQNDAVWAWLSARRSAGDMSLPLVLKAKPVRTWFREDQTNGIIRWTWLKGRGMTLRGWSRADDETVFFHARSVAVLAWLRDERGFTPSADESLTWIGSSNLYRPGIKTSWRRTVLPLLNVVWPGSARAIVIPPFDHGSARPMLYVSPDSVCYLSTWFSPDEYFQTQCLHTCKRRIARMQWLRLRWPDYVPAVNVRAAWLHHAGAHLAWTPAQRQRMTTGMVARRLFALERVTLRMAWPECVALLPCQGIMQQFPTGVYVDNTAAAAASGDEVDDVLLVKEGAVPRTVEKLYYDPIVGVMRTSAPPPPAPPAPPPARVWEDSLLSMNWQDVMRAYQQRLIHGSYTVD